MDDLLSATLEKVARGDDATEPNRSGTAAAERTRRREVANAEADARLVEQLKRGVNALLDRKAEKIVVLNLQGLTSMSDYFVLASATNERQAQALADSVEEALREAGRRPLSIEGYQAASWILLDYGDVVFHVFHDEARRFYGLERLWGDAPDATSSFVSSPVRH